MSSMIVMGNQDLCVVYNLLMVIMVLVWMLYPVLSPLNMMKIIIMMKVMNMLEKEVTSKIMVHRLQCMLIFHNIKSKILMLIGLRVVLGKLKTSVWYKIFSFWKTFKIYERKGFILFSGVRPDKEATKEKN